MVSQAFKQTVEQYAAESLTRNPIYVLPAEGKLQPDQLKYYLQGIEYLIRHTPIYLKRARDVAKARNQDKLAEFFNHKFEEEQGHDAWAREDMERVSHAGARVGDVPVSPAIVDLVTFLGNVIEEDPTLYVPYTFLAEYFTVLVGPSLVNSVAEKCGMDNCISVVANHVQLDQAHVTQGLETFDTIVPLNHLESCLAVLDRAMVFYRAFGQEVGNANQSGNA
jgi:hypothetical protein